MSASKVILVAADKPFSKDATAKIQQVAAQFPGFQLELLQGYKTRDDLLKAVVNADALVVRSDKVDEALLNVAPKLKVIARAGSGFDTIDTASCKKRGIAVLNTPGQNSNAVAELVFALALHVMRRGFGKVSGFELRGKRMGIHGFGAIGKIVAGIAKNGFGMEISAYDPFVKAEEMAALGVQHCETLEELYSSCDVVSVHTPLNPQTKNSVTEALLHKMKPLAVLVNTARAEVVDENALKAIFESSKGFAYCADVAPKCAADLVAKYPERVFFTQIKCGAQTEEANANCGTAAVREIVDFIDNGVTKFQVNK